MSFNQTGRIVGQLQAGALARGRPSPRRAGGRFLARMCQLLGKKPCRAKRHRASGVGPCSGPANTAAGMFLAKLSHDFFAAWNTDGRQEAGWE